MTRLLNYLLSLQRTEEQKPSAWLEGFFFMCFNQLMSAATLKLKWKNIKYKNV